MALSSAFSSEEEEQRRQEQRRKVEEVGEEEENNEKVECENEEEEGESVEPVTPITKLQTQRCSNGEEEESESDADASLNEGTETRSSHTRKRPSNASEAEKHSKRIKNEVPKEIVKKSEESSPKKPLFQSIWSKDDEIVILKGMVKYIERGGNPHTDSIGFLKSIKKSLHFDASPDELKLKIRELKKKFHDLKLYELSKKIWGGEESKSRTGYVETRSTSGKKNRVRLDSPRNLPLEMNEGNILNDLLESESTRTLTPPRVGLMREGICLIDCSMSKELKLKWKKLLISETELYLKQAELGKERAKLMLEALKASD